MKANIYIAEKIKVGFNVRADTYTGALGYIIPWDKTKKVWRKLNSWENWREKYRTPEEADLKKREEFEKARVRVEKYYQTDILYLEQNPTMPLSDMVRNWGGRLVNNKEREQGMWKQKRESVDKGVEAYYHLHNCKSLASFDYRERNISTNPLVQVQEHENTPLEGFVLNKKAGGYSSGWNHRQAVCRVYDPRGFEFEISIENLLYILEHTNSMVGKGLEGKFIYGWDREKLVLLPEGCTEFGSMKTFTKLQETNLSVKSLVVGKKYLTKANDEWLYLGRMLIYDSGWSNQKQINQFVFFNLKSEVSDSFEFRKTCTTLSMEASPEVFQEELDAALELLQHHSNFALIDNSKDEWTEVKPEEIYDLSDAGKDIYYKDSNKYEQVNNYYMKYYKEHVPVRKKYYIRKQFLTNGKEYKKGPTYLTTEK